MRPQHITAENGGALRERTSTGAASMRPQHITAENHTLPVTFGSPVGRFNEAAAYHCGKRSRRKPISPYQRRASMRPQHITAENASGSGGTGRTGMLQ